MTKDNTPDCLKKHAVDLMRHAAEHDVAVVVLMRNQDEYVVTRGSNLQTAAMEALLIKASLTEFEGGTSELEIVDIDIVEVKGEVKGHG